MRILTTFFAFIFSVTAALAAELNEKEQADISTQIEAVMTRYNSGESDAIVDVMPQAAIDKFGGREALKRMTAEALQQQKARNMVFEKFAVGKVSKTIMANETTLVIVPTEVALKVGEKRLTGTGFMIASREKGADKWQLLGGDGINRNPEMLPQIFKGFPAGIQFPPVKYELN